MLLPLLKEILVNLANKKSANITISCALICLAIFPLFTAIVLHAADTTAVTKATYLVENAAKSGAALINSQGRDVAYNTANTILQGYKNKAISVITCKINENQSEDKDKDKSEDKDKDKSENNKCVKIVVILKKVFGNGNHIIRATAASYSDKSKIGSFLLP